jgi:DnaJ-class molecular chaperone
MMKDYYGALGIPDTYAYFDHEHAYHRPGLRWHPDLNGGEVWAVEHFQLVSKDIPTH